MKRRTRTVVQDPPARGYCPICFKEGALKAGKVRPHKVRNITGGRYVCPGDGEIALRELPQDVAHHHDRDQEIGRIARIHHSSVTEVSKAAASGKKTRLYAKRTRAIPKRPSHKATAPNSEILLQLADPLELSGDRESDLRLTVKELGEVMSRTPAFDFRYCPVCFRNVGVKASKGHAVCYHTAEVDELNVQRVDVTPENTKQLACLGFVKNMPGLTLGELQESSLGKWRENTVSSTEIDAIKADQAQFLTSLYEQAVEQVRSLGEKDSFTRDDLIKVGAVRLLSNTDNAIGDLPPVVVQEGGTDGNQAVIIESLDSDIKDLEDRLAREQDRADQLARLLDDFNNGRVPVEAEVDARVKMALEAMGHVDNTMPTEEELKTAARKVLGADALNTRLADALDALGFDVDRIVAGEPIEAQIMEPPEDDEMQTTPDGYMPYELFEEDDRRMRTREVSSNGVGQGFTMEEIGAMIAGALAAERRRITSSINS